MNCGDGTASSRNSNSGISDTAVIMQYKYPYNYIDWYDTYDLCKSLSGTNENVTTSLVWGTTWDNTLRFLVATGNKNYEDFIDSSSWGNYMNVTFDFIDMNGTEKAKSAGWGGTIIPTGSTEYTKTCNIYDLAGNIWEWTCENYKPGFISNFMYFCRRGGTYYWPGAENDEGYQYFCVSNRYYYYNSGSSLNQRSSQYGGRAVLWIS